ncbi:MAG: hypothetical protein Kow00129_10560 [Thermoleophilia bacterium]
MPLPDSFRNYVVQGAGVSPRGSESAALDGLKGPSAEKHPPQTSSRPRWRLRLPLKAKNARKYGIPILSVEEFLTGRGRKS